MMLRASHKKGRPGARSGRNSPETSPEPGFFKVHWLVLAMAFAVLTASLIFLPRRESLLQEELDISVVAESEIRAAFFFETVDLQATAEARAAAGAEVPQYYRVDSDQVEHQLRLLRDRIGRVRAERSRVSESVRRALLESMSTQSTQEVVSRAVSLLCGELKQDPAWEEMPEAAVLALWLTPDLDTLPQRQFAPPATNQSEDTPRPVEALHPPEAQPMTFSFGDRLGELTLESLAYVLNQGVRAESEIGTQRIVILRETPAAESQSSQQMTLNDGPDPATAAQKGLSARLLEAGKRAARGVDEPTEWARLHDAALPMAASLVTDSIRFDRVHTAEARERAREAVAPVMKEIEAGEIIQDRGRRWTAQSRSDVKTYLSILEREEEPVQRIAGSVAARLILVGLVLYCLLQAAGLLKRSSDDGNPVREINLALLLMCAALVAGRAAFYFEPSGFMVPVAAIGILYAILVNVRMAAMVSALTALLVSAQYGFDWRVFFVSVTMSLAGVFSISKVRRRSDMATAAIKATLIGIVAVTAVILASDAIMSEAAARRLLLVLFNGIICLLVVPGVLSPLERLFGITTDIQLLEYSDLNNEVLSQLAIKAPATYAHCLMLGQLAEAAAEAIGANGLLARVCAYYHDIGKMRRSEYFSENQTGYNIHDELSPRLSARAIAAHVIQGAEMAREYRLPRPIIDGILEHHGTCRIGYFYQQALEQQKHGDVREEDFRYPGPKPQRPETAILMICDAVESGIRSIKNPNEERVREFVDKIVENRSADNQFDDCGLTFKQLDTITSVIAGRIVSSLHTRVAYPDTKPPPCENVVAMSGGAK